MTLKNTLAVVSISRRFSLPLRFLPHACAGLLALFTALAQAANNDDGGLSLSLAPSLQATAKPTRGTPPTPPQSASAPAPTPSLAPPTSTPNPSPSLPPLRASENRPAETRGGDIQVREIGGQPQINKPIDLTTPADDLWERIRNGFGMPNLNNDAVLYQQAWYLNHPDYMRRMVERSRRYMHYIVEELEKRGMPTELALLPMVESAYNPMALSRSQAMGLWQFIPTTGKNYKLRQNWWTDQRRDIVASTSAALDYLQSIYEMHGDWFLALASYNWGEGAVARAIAKNKARGLPTDYESINMPTETRNYVPKLQALKNILSSPRLMAELNLPAIPNRAYFSTIPKPADMDVKIAAKLAEMPLEEFVALNPAHNRPVIKGEASLVLPAEKVDTFMANLENHQQKDRPLTSWRGYTLKKGEKIEQVAARYNIAVAQLRTVNGLPPKKRIGAGTTLLVPASGNDTGQPLPDAPQVVIEPDPVKTHILKKGETLTMVAKRNRISLTDLLRWNRLKTPKAPAGTRLIVGLPHVDNNDKREAPAEVVASTSKTTAPAPSGRAANTSNTTKAGKAAGNAKAAAKTTRYIVKRGDTLITIAHRFKVNAAELKRNNHLTSNALKPGQTLTIEVASSN